MRYPKQIFRGPWASPLGAVFTFVIPMLLVVNVPASVMVKLLAPEAVNPGLIAFTVLATVVLVWASRGFFRRSSTFCSSRRTSPISCGIEFWAARAKFWSG